MVTSIIVTFPEIVSTIDELSVNTWKIVKFKRQNLRNKKAQTFRTLPFFSDGLLVKEYVVRNNCLIYEYDPF